MATVSIPANVYFSGLKAKVPPRGKIHYKGLVTSLSALAAIAKPSAGDVYNVTEVSGGDNYMWNGTAWVKLESPDTPVTMPDESESESES